jgi:hypothetical protein
MMDVVKSANMAKPLSRERSLLEPGAFYVKISVHQTEHEITPEEACGGGHQVEKQCNF